VEEQMFASYTGPVPDVYKRYIDDCTGVATCPESDLSKFINFVSTFHPALKYTFEISRTSLPFLDLFICIQADSDRLSTSVFYKDTDSHSYLLYSSSHPKSCRDSIPYSQFLRLRRLCSEQHDFETKIQEMASFFKNRQYPTPTVESALTRTGNLNREATLMPKTTSDSEDRPVLAIKYHPHNLQVKNVLLRNFHIIQDDPDLAEIFPKPPLVAYKRDNNIRDQLVRAQFKEPSSNQPNTPGTSRCDRARCKTCPFIDGSDHLQFPSGTFNIHHKFDCKTTDLVYVLLCTLCNKKYIGETYRSLEQRFSEHLRSIRLNYANPIGKHFNLPGHDASQHLRVAVLWSNSRSRNYRKFMETRLITRLGTREPMGLNTR
jgi:hypothetical protein